MVCRNHKKVWKIFREEGWVAQSEATRFHNLDHSYQIRINSLAWDSSAPWSNEYVEMSVHMTQHDLIRPDESQWSNWVMHLKKRWNDVSCLQRLKFKFPKYWGHHFVLLTSEAKTLMKPLHSRALLLTIAFIVDATTLAFCSLSTFWELEPFPSLNSILPHKTHTQPPLITITSIIDGIWRPHLWVHFSTSENRKSATHIGLNFYLLNVFIMLLLCSYLHYIIVTKSLKVEIMDCYNLWLCLCLLVMNCYDWV